MSIFSFIRRGRQAAKEAKAQKAEKEKKEADKPPYRHIPKHAAIDAVSGGPGGWSEDDRQKIIDQNKRRSAMTASGVGMTGAMTPVHSGTLTPIHPGAMTPVYAGVARAHSSLSHVSYPATSASPVVQFQRSSSYSSVSSAWNYRGEETTYIPVDTNARSYKGKEVERGMNDPARHSRSSSRYSTARFSMPISAIVTNGDRSVSPVGSSSNNSTSSQDDLEMKPSKRISMPPSTSATRGYTQRPVSQNGSIHRLHPARRLSDAGQTTAAGSRNSFSPRPSSLVPGAPPVPAIPVAQFTASGLAPAVGSAVSSVTMVPVASSASLAAKVTPVVISYVAPKAEQREDDDQEVFLTPENSGDESSTVGTAITASEPVSTSPSRARGADAKSTKSTELQTINSIISASVEAATVPQKMSPLETIKQLNEKQRVSAAVVETLPVDFKEGSLPAPKALDSAVPAQKTGKLSKNSAPKSPKRIRWSLRSTKNTAVAV
ncbi:hypothetical protein QBC42DRAFT_265097 [Cladorrhinum samala]|uniref:Uncharacterized protein n=1 Tax=Cladorrhinum samala TaxID=585594 RepID=A0AAV9HSA2_9PEZI|nr:hypothetical protein QBC42DRAFT_265097 [Cladorrhinum samala]